MFDAGAWKRTAVGHAFAWSPLYHQLRARFTVLFLREDLYTSRSAHKTRRPLAHLKSIVYKSEIQNQFEGVWSAWPAVYSSEISWSGLLSFGSKSSLRERERGLDSGFYVNLRSWFWAGLNYSLPQRGRATCKLCEPFVELLGYSF